MVSEPVHQFRVSSAEGVDQMASLEELQSATKTEKPLCDVLVLDGRLRQSLATVRSLGSRGIQVAVLESSADAPAFSSRWCRQKFVCPAEEGSQEYLDFLMQVLDATGARVLISSSEAIIELLRRHRQGLEQRVRLALAKEPALGIAINKEQTLDIARRLGLKVPRGVHGPRRDLPTSLSVRAGVGRASVVTPSGRGALVGGPTPTSGNSTLNVAPWPSGLLAVMVP